MDTVCGESGTETDDYVFEEILNNPNCGFVTITSKIDTGELAVLLIIGNAENW